MNVTGHRQAETARYSAGTPDNQREWWVAQCWCGWSSPPCSSTELANDAHRRHAQRVTPA